MVHNPGRLRFAPLSMSVLSGAFWLAAPASSMGQQSSDVPASQLPEVTVTAERTESVLRKTPVSVGVINTEGVENKGSGS